MKLESTSRGAAQASWREAVLHGLAPDGGLYVPVSVPQLSAADLRALSRMTFPELSCELAVRFLGDDVPRPVLEEICSDAFTFDAPLHSLDDRTHVLELFHGPTCAFKDFGARFMSRLFRHFWGVQERPLTVLVATSGDTGSAVANAFHEPERNSSIRVVILFPKGKVSLVQEKQMTTLGGNVTALEVDGTFDDCQRLVKQALADRSVAQHTAITSANSINIARLVPQMFYYVYAALQFLDTGPAVFSVPSGNLGNLTGGLLARAIGVPVRRFVAATNINDTFPKYLASGHFEPHASRETCSNAMDVGNPSNFARIASMFHGDVAEARSAVTGYSVSESDTLAGIGHTFRSTGYLLDPHTAVGVCALERHRAATPGDAQSPGIVLATAHPAKFAAVVAQAAGMEPHLPKQLVAALSQEGCKVSMTCSYDELRDNLCREV